MGFMLHQGPETHPFLQNVMLVCQTNHEERDTFQTEFKGRFRWASLAKERGGEEVEGKGEEWRASEKDDDSLSLLISGIIPFHLLPLTCQAVSNLFLPGHTSISGKRATRRKKKWVNEIETGRY